MLVLEVSLEQFAAGYYGCTVRQLQLARHVQRLFRKARRYRRRPPAHFNPVPR